MEAPLFHFRDRATGKLIAVFDISLLKGEVPYPYVLQWEQYKLVHAALPHIKASGLGEVRFSTKLTGLAQTADHVETTVTNAAGETETLRGKYLIGSDGGSSTCGASPTSRLTASPGPSASSRSAPVSISALRPRLLHAQLFLRSRRVDQSVQGQRQGHPASGAECFRCRNRRPTRRR